MNVKRLLLPMMLLALLVAGCGQEKGYSVNKADTEGVWVDSGDLDYHVQGSRALNPNQVPDDRYLQGVPASVAQPTGKETWFAVFLRIENKSGKTAATARNFEIEDTEGHKFTPIALDPKANAFAYQPTDLDDAQVVPHPDSTQDLDSASGAMLLFKLPLTTIANRPLEFRITAPPGQPAPASATVTLDV